MQQAINEALKADPNKVYSNPLVGCVIVKNDKIIGRGYHQAFGTKHAEVNAIESLKNPVRDADLYVTLEPCAHFGNNPPCVDAIIKSKMFKKVIIAVADPNKKAMGGIDELKKANIEVCQNSRWIYSSFRWKFKMDYGRRCSKRRSSYKVWLRWNFGW